MRIYVLSGQLGAGGVPKVIYNISKHLQDSVDALRVAYLGGNNESVDRLRAAGIEVECLGNRFPDRNHLFRLHRSLRTFAPDIIHTHMGGASLLGRCVGRLHKIAVVSTMHNIYTERAPQARIIDHPTSVLADAIVSVSVAVQQSLPRTFGLGASSTVIHNCIDMERVIEQGRTTEEIPDWLSNIPEGPLVACVSRMSEKKGQHHLIRAFRSIQKQFPNAQLVLTGWSDHKQRLIQLTDNLGLTESVHFLGKVDNPYAVFDAANVVVFPSKFEGFSIGMLEAMSFGKPIVATGISPFREALGTEYEYATPECPAELANLIKTYLTDRNIAQHRGQIAKDRVKTQFSGTVGAQAHRELYADLLNQST